MLLAGPIAATLSLAQPVLAGEVTGVEVRDDAITVQFDDLVEGASSLTLVAPNRIALDVRGATSRPASYAERGLVRSVRIAQADADTARVVLDLAQPARISGGDFAPDGRSLTLTIATIGELAGQGAPGAADRKDFVPPAAFRAAPPAKRYSVRIPLPRPTKTLPLPKIAGPDDPGRPLVVIDAGHGGHDPGAISPHGGQREKDVTLAIARAIRDALVATGRVRVALTRDSDEFLVLEERYALARRMKADLFISVHADSAETPGARGATVYTLSEIASDREAARLAARENKADILNGVNLADRPDDVSSILIDLTQRETMSQSSDFARLLQREGEGALPFRSDAHRFASFVVLKAPDVPSVLLEGGYLSNRDDVQLLASRAGQRKIADAVAQATTLFFARKLAQR